MQGPGADGLKSLLAVLLLEAPAFLMCHSISRSAAAGRGSQSFSGLESL